MKNTPPERQRLRKLSCQSTDGFLISLLSAGEAETSEEKTVRAPNRGVQSSFPVLDCGAKARTEGVFFTDAGSSLDSTLAHIYIYMYNYIHIYIYIYIYM